MRPDPKVLSGGGRVSLVSSEADLDTALPDELLLPTAAAMQLPACLATGSASCPGGALRCQNGFAECGRPGQAATITATVRDSRCEDGSPPINTPLASLPLRTSFVMKSGEGGHTHQAVDTSATEPIPGSPQAVLAVRPTAFSTGGGTVARFEPSSGLWTARTDPAGELRATVTAGEVSGEAEIAVSEDPDSLAAIFASYVLAPGAVLEMPAPLTLAVRFVPPSQILREIEPQPGLYNLSGNPQTPSSPESLNHDSNHWIDPAIQHLITGMATAFKLDHPFIDDGSVLTHDEDLILNIDDASLADGGLFDKSATYTFPHEFHRAGRDVDILHSHLHDFANGHNPPSTSREILRGSLRGLEAYILSKGGVIYLEPQIHVRFP